MAASIWTLSSGVANGWIEDIAIDPVDSQTVFIADRSHVRRSTDGGDAFEPVLEGRNQAGENHIMNTLAIDPSTPPYLRRRWQFYFSKSGGRSMGKHGRRRHVAAYRIDQCNRK